MTDEIKDVANQDDLDTVLADNPADTIDDTMGAVFDSMQDAEVPASVDPEPTGEATPSEDPVVPTPDTITDGRDPETGRFVAKTIPDPGEPEPQKVEPLTAPSEWSDDGKALFGASTPEMQAFLLSQAEASTTATGEITSQLKGYDSLEQILGPRRAALAAQYGTTENGIQQLFAIADYAEKDPVGFVQYFMGQRGMNSTHLTPQTTEEAVDEYADPQVVALTKQVQELQGNIQGLTNVHQQDGERHLQGVVDDFKTNHSHYDAIEVDMMALIPSIQKMTPGLTPTEVLQTAYDKAKWSNPAVREDLLGEQHQAETAKKEADEAARKAEVDKVAADARTAVASNVAATGVGVGQNPVGKTIDDSMRGAYDRAQGAST